ncbi:hypothetical protein HYFRA_00000083 [Hymenoscyphus fraxineus]|uniref:Uncharacterized protein n=1 Tax=Hymenoscyphus fraxineus TaxID=746836 RepID=A0A9N9L096_9HELO|nr:hypothetical protein HYFRA_00000083 [Hymenoscyphus fraxineus]
MDPTSKNPERAFALQKYLILHSQHDAIVKRLNSLPGSSTNSPTHSPSGHRGFSRSPSSESEENFDLSSEPPVGFRHHHRGGSIPTSRCRPRPQLRTRRSSLPTVIDESILHEIEEDQMKLKDVNQQIKTTLTDLLNCESVRSDNRYRKWVMEKLMAAEKELKENRSLSCERRKSVDFNGMGF